MKKNVFILLFDGFSDWEIAYVTPELQKSPKFELHYISFDNLPITSMGGLQVRPSISMNEMAAYKMDMLILPGGEFWEGEDFKSKESVLKSFLKRAKSIAAICAATTFLGRQGLLDHLQHTSNDLDYLKEMAPDYKGEKNYQHNVAISDGHIITANGTAPIEFAREIFLKLKLYKPADIEKWFQLFKNGVWAG